METTQMHSAANAAPSATTAPAAPVTLRSYEDLPGPRAVALFGNALQIDMPQAHLQFEEWCREYGALFKVRMGSRKLLVVGEHELIAKILRDRPDGFGRSDRLQEMWHEMGLPGGVFSTNGEVWKRQRRMVLSSFDPAHVKNYFPALQGVAQRLCGRWQKAAAAGQAIDLQADLMRFTVDTIAGLAFGAEVNTLESDQDVIQQHLDKIFPALFSRIFAVIPVWRIRRSASDKQLEKSVREVMLAVDGFVAQARARMQADAGLHQHPTNLLEAMIAAADQPDSGIDDSQVAGNVLTMLLAGEDTTANTLAWMIHLLWLNPATLALATAEVRRVCVGSSVPTLEQLSQLDYVEACAHETMRLKPVAPQIPQQAHKDTVVGDVMVPAGTMVICLMRTDSVSDAHIAQADRFAPERWLGQGELAHSSSSAKRIAMPFGAGPRICPGRYLALLEMKMAMAILLLNFEIQNVSTPDGQPARELLKFTMTPVGLKMQLAARQL
ncbi:cytochrome P450 [Undibacterium parvum]|nr:cytochrome P450 [Undibacterium parvum]